ncbi:MAG: PAP/fibrillin family protein [Cyanobacteria bacterium REEB459]|nr:PAP/fibrillin family protein [Cyanobacteria bacterium REEB459]
MLGKAELLETLAPLDRGLRATPEDRLAVQAAVVKLEGRNPTADPLAAAHLLNGNWRLLYTTSTELLNLGRLPLTSLGPIYQALRLEENRIYNLAEVVGPPGLSGLVAVSARLEAVSQSRARVYFERGVLGLQSLLGYSSADQFIVRLQANPKLPLLQGIDFTINSQREPGWLEITYLDENLRISRGNQGNLFVLTR